MNAITKNPFITGLFLALSVVITDYLQNVINGNKFNWSAFAVACGIALVGFIGKFLSGKTNTSMSMFGSALLTIVPLLTGTHLQWELIAATFMIKLFGLFTAGAATEKPN
jgi:hypothetical protein